MTAMPHALDRVVVEVDVRHLQVVRQRIAASTAKPWFCVVISTRPRGVVQHRLVRPAMAELQLVGLRPAGQAQAADGPGRCRRSASCPTDRGSSAGRSPAAPDRRDRWRETRRRAAAGQDVVGRGRAGQDRHAAAHVEQVPGDVPLHAVIQGDHVRRAGLETGSASPRRRSRAQGLSGSRPLDRPVRESPRAPGRGRPAPDWRLALATRRASSRSIVERTPFIAPRMRMPPHQRPGVDALQADDAVAAEILVQLPVGAEIARPAGSARGR